MTLAELLAVLPGLSIDTVTGDAGARQVAAVSYDSRKAVSGSVFVALRGEHVNGETFAPQAIARGAVAVVAEGDAPADVRVPWIRVPDGRAALAMLAASFYGAPSRELRLVGVTGTNGKTTTAYLLSAIFEAAGTRTGLVGTIVYRVAGREVDATRTTPESADLQQLLREMVQQGCGACIMEVSSHALALHRVDDLHFAAAVFTNLTRDHLDFHRDMDGYFQAKRRLFDMLPAGAPSVVNVDDPRGQSLAASLPGAVTYAIDRPAQVTPRSLAFSLTGLTFTLSTPWGDVHVRSRLVGRANTYNILAAAATSLALGIPVEAVERGLEQLEAVPGRFQVVSGPDDDVTVVVDYAHTDDALKNLLETARPLASRRLITVFGCGGDRDRTKRPLMGAVAARMSDLVVVTSDNPRSEDPARIIEEIKRGIVPPQAAARPGAPRERQRAVSAPSTPYLAIVDRRLAIQRAIELARPGDVVLIAGKGHETYQVSGERVLPFDDSAVAREALGRRRAA